jgi:hypothetical protein
MHNEVISLKQVVGVVYRITADNSLNPKTRYNALISECH